jgi:hypothetical protein
MMSRLFSFRSLALVAAVIAGTATLSAGTAEAGDCSRRPAVVYVPAQPVYVVRPAPVVRHVIVVQPAPVYRPACH